MPDPLDARPDVDELITRLRERVEERRRSGQYPEGLEADLDRHFEMAVAASLRARADLGELLENVRVASAQIGEEHISTISSVPFGSSVHRSIARLVHRQTEGVLHQVRQHTRAVDALLEVVVTQELPDIVARLDAVMERLVAYERLPEASDDTSRALAARLERLERKIDERAPKPPGD